MHSIIQLFIRHGGLLTLFVLQVICLFLIASYNKGQKEVAMASWGKYSGVVMNWKTRVYDYFDLQDENKRLREENAFLQTQIANLHQPEPPKADSLLFGKRDSSGRVSPRPEYSFIPAKVISNTVSGRNNWLIINRGSKDGVQPNSGVISADGVVGVARYVTEDFTKVMSVLHQQTRVSAMIKKFPEFFGPLTWDGGNPQILTLTDIPYHVDVRPRDTVVISQYSLLFPAGHMVGIVDTAYKVPGSNFLHIDVRPSQNPAGVRTVYVVNNKFSAQLDQLQQADKDE